MYTEIFQWLSSSVRLQGNPGDTSVVHLSGTWRVLFIQARFKLGGGGVATALTAWRSYRSVYPRLLLSLVEVERYNELSALLGIKDQT